MIGKLLKTQDHDIKYSCVKFIICLINFCLSEEFLFDSTILSSTSSKISALVMGHLIPQLEVLIDESEVVANMMFKLMSEIFYKRPMFTNKFWEACNMEKIAKFYGENATLNVMKTVELLFEMRRK